MTRRVLVRDVLPFILFLCLAVVMTWPWVLHLRDAAADAGDSYLGAWILWWDYHATFTGPAQLFHANIFYPYSYTLAFSEHYYGISLLFFPLFALGLRPLTVNGIATIVGFAFSGYGMFRLTRTLTASTGAAWVAGVAFAFVPYRFHNLPHLVYLFSGWMPLQVEALVLFARERTRGRAAWLGVAFFMNALTCIHWFVLTLIPMFLTALFLALRYKVESDRNFWMRGSVAVGAASIALLPFMIPYIRVAQLYGFTRGPQEVAAFSARWQNWLLVDWQNKLWAGFGLKLTPYVTELALFPGLLILLLAVAALLLPGSEEKEKLPRDRECNDESGDSNRGTRTRWQNRLRVFLDATAITAAIVALLAAGFGSFKLHIFSHQLFSASDPLIALAVSAVAVFFRCFLAYPKALRFFARKNLIEAFRAGERPEVFGVGVIWALTGFLGTFGMNFFFHRALYTFVPLFRSVRVPARWAMVCYLGLALLAGLGAHRMVESIVFRRRAWSPALYGLITVLVLFDQRAAPLQLIRGAVDPDALTIHLRQTPMRGGIVELPSGEGDANYVYVLRAADHARPLVDGVSGFQPRIQTAIERMTRSRPVPSDFLDLLEAIPASYVVVHHSRLVEENRSAIEDFFERGVKAGRLRLIRRFGEGAKSDDLYAVTKTEPEE
jgi:hypothetical protein